MKSRLMQYLLFTTLLTLTTSQAQDAKVKSSIKSNGQLVYSIGQKNVDNFSDMFQEGEFYGRLRNNSFYFAYDTPNDKTTTQLISGVGASFIYKSAAFNGFDFSIGLYGSQAFFDEDHIDEISHLKPGKN